MVKTLFSVALVATAFAGHLSAQTCSDGSCRLQHNTGYNNYDNYSVQRTGYDPSPWNPNAQSPYSPFDENRIPASLQPSIDQFGGNDGPNSICKDGCCGPNGGQGCADGQCSGGRCMEGWGGEGMHRRGPNDGSGYLTRRDRYRNSDQGLNGNLSWPNDRRQLTGNDYRSNYPNDNRPFGDPNLWNRSGTSSNYMPTVTNRLNPGSASINWQSTFDTGLQAARQTGRPMLVRVTADWCNYCQQMKQETFTDSRIIQDAAEFVSIDLNADANRSLVEQMGVRTLPTVLVIAPDLRIVDRVEGFRNADDLARILSRHTQRAQLERDVKVAAR
ncbi:MAG: thioredoxin family protein [Planctomycetaceae bacterium]|nr:thioredoxin family protein [Planctomycetaceae bacterium]